MNRVSIRPELLRWACERSGRDVSYVTQRMKQFPAWLDQSKQPTFKQLERFASLTHTPFGYLFLDRPPVEQMPVPDFRTVTGDSIRKPSVDLLDTIYTMQLRQAWLREHLLEIDAPPCSFVGSARLSDDAEAIGREIRRSLGLGDEWATGLRSWEEAVGALRGQIEELRVMAVVNGVVGNSTRRKLNVTEFRGFALPDGMAPLIFVNGADAKSAQMFTLAHEIAHVWLGEEGLSGFESMLPQGTEIEEWCNRAAAELLAPADAVSKRWYKVRRQSNPFHALARTFKVSPIVAARRTLDLNLIERSAYFEFYEKYLQQVKTGDADGGNFYNNQNSRVGQMFAKYVMDAALEGRISFKNAYELTGLYGGTFQKYAKTLGVVLP